MTNTIDNSEVDAPHEARVVSLLRKMPRRTPKITGFTSTDSYATVTNSEIMAGDCDKLRYVVEEEGTNSIDARVVGRMYDDAGNSSAWVQQVEKTAISGSAVELDPGNTDYDEYAVQIKANNAGSQGDATVHGLAKSSQ